jgi:hypothetical protein
MLRRMPHLAAGASGLAAAAALAALAQGRTTARAAAAEGGAGAAAAPAAVEIHCSPISPLCARYKAFLAWQKVPTKVVDTLPLGKDRPPHVVADGVQVADLPGLVAQLRSARGGAAGGRAQAPAAATAEESHWVQWVDDKLLPHVFVNVFRSPGEAEQAMDTAVQRGDFNVVYSTFLRQIGSYYMYTSAKMAKRKMEVRAV